MSPEASSSLTSRTAYLSMFEFLRRYYQRGKSEEIAGLLGGLSLLGDGMSADPAMLNDFNAAVREVLRLEADGGYVQAQGNLDSAGRSSD